jgi:hypothetical protein
MSTRSGRVYCCWTSIAELVFVSGPIVGHMTIFLFFPRLLRVFKWSLLFDEWKNLVLVTLPSPGGDSSGRSLTHSLTHSLTNLRWDVNGDTKGSSDSPL